jgi:divalent metal cation (Fe/Co/Zn/Cd) transporter
VTPSNRTLDLRSAVRLCGSTVVWNSVAGTAAVVMGILSGSLALMGFGLEAAIDGVASAVLVWRFRSEERDASRAEEIERRTVRVVGLTLLLVSAYLLAQAIRSLVMRSRPEASAVGIALAGCSLGILPPLAFLKYRLARRLSSHALRGDSLLTAAGALLAGIALLGLALRAALGWWWADPIAGALISVALAFEGRRMLREPSRASGRPLL